MKVIQPVYRSTNLSKKYFELYFPRHASDIEHGGFLKIQTVVLLQRPNREITGMRNRYFRYPFMYSVVTDFMNLFAGYPSQRQFSRGVVYSGTCGGEFLVSVAPFSSVLVVLSSKTKTPNQRPLLRSRPRSKRP